MTVFMILLASLGIIGIFATVFEVARDGYRRTPTRQDPRQLDENVDRP